MVENLNRYLIGWRGYFGYCQSRSILQVLDCWIRRRLRCVYWRRWKRGKKRFVELRKLDIRKELAARAAGSIHGPWRLNRSCISQRGFGNITSQDFSRDHFVYNAENDCFTCPAGQKLTRARYNGVVKYRAERQTCQSCEYRSKCARSSKNGRIVSRKIGIDYRRWAYNCLSRETRFYLLKRRKYKIEGSFADVSNNHGFKNARCRSLEKVTIQNLLIATIKTFASFSKPIH